MLAGALSSTVSSLAESASGVMKYIGQQMALFSDKYKANISAKMFTLLEKCDGAESLEVLFKENDIKECEKDAMIAEILKLWSLRLIILKT